MSVTLFRGGKEAQGFFHDMMRGGVKLAGLDIVLTLNGLNVPFMVDKVVWGAVCSLTDESRMSAWRKRIDEYLTRPEFFDIINELAQILNSPATGKEASTE